MFISLNSCRESVGAGSPRSRLQKQDIDKPAPRFRIQKQNLDKPALDCILNIYLAEKYLLDFK